MSVTLNSSKEEEEEGRSRKGGHFPGNSSGVKLAALRVLPNPLHAAGHARQAPM